MMMIKKSPLLPPPPRIDFQRSCSTTRPSFPVCVHDAGFEEVGAGRERGGRERGERERETERVGREREREREREIELVISDVFACPCTIQVCVTGLKAPTN